MIWRDRFLCGVCLVLMVGTRAYSGPVNPPFFPTFASGAPSAGAPKSQLYFDTDTTPLGAYVWQPSASVWQPYGGGGGACAGSAGDMLYSSTGSNCIGATLQWNGAQLVWASNGRLDDPGDIITSGGFNVTVGAGGNISFATGATLSTTNGTLNISSANGVLNLTADTDLNLNAATVALNGLAFRFFATADDAAATAALDLFTPSLQGVVPASPGGTSDFLRADGSWAVPPVGSIVTWPANNDALISSGNDTPQGVAPCAGVLISNGSTWSCGPVPSAVGGNTGLYAPPLASSFTVFSGDATNPTLTDTNYGMVMDAGASNVSGPVRGAMRALSLPPWSVTAGVKITVAPFNPRNCGLAVSDGTKLEILNYIWGSSSNSVLQRTNYSNPNAFSSNPMATDSAPVDYLRISDDGVTRTFYISNDGRNFALVDSELSAAFLVATEAGIACGTLNSIGPSGDHLFETVFYWTN